MKNFIQKILITTALLMNLLIGVNVPVYAATTCPKDGTSAGQVVDGIGVTGDSCDKNKDKIVNIIGDVTRLISYFAGVAAVIMVIVAGFKYITSGGDSAKVTSAKNTLIYALIGIAVAVLAQFIIQFVISATLKNK